jgi:hypothetical protein
MSKLKLDQRGRISLEDGTMSPYSYGCAFAFVGGRLLVLGSGERECELIVHVHAPGPAGWHRVDRVVLPMVSCGVPNAAIFPWSDRQAYIHCFDPEHGGHQAALLDVERSTVTPTPLREHGRPICRFADRSVHWRYSNELELFVVDATGAAQRILADAEPAPRDAEVAFQDGSLWVLAVSGEVGSVYEIDPETGVTRRSVAMPGPVGVIRPRVVQTPTGLLISGPNLVRVPYETMVPEVVGPLPWARGSNLHSMGSLLLTTLGAPGSPVLVFDMALSPVAEISLDKRGEWFLGTSAAQGPDVLALKFSADRSASQGVQLLRVEGRSLSPARVMHDELTRAQRFDAAYPGFLASDRKRPTRVRSWQLAALIYESLVAENLASPFTLSGFATLHPKKKIDPGEEQLVKEAVAYIAFAVETSTTLPSLRCLGNDELELIKFELYPFFDGEDDTFAILDLSGIEVCSGLEEARLTLGAGRRAADVAPLTALPRLAKLELSGSIANLAALKGATALRQLTIGADTKLEAAEVESLRAARPDIEVIA